MYDSGLSRVNFYDSASNYANSKLAYNSNYVKNASNVYKTQTDKYVSSQGNTCTDGKDDGKVGFLSALGNIVEGAGKSILNGIKGMFTDKEGNFSLLQTAKTVALGAACIAFPAVGLAACGIGAVTGGIKLVNGVSTALNAKTDAEAKDAWEAVGDGGLTVGMSVLGAKASYNAVKGGAVKLNGISELEQLKGAPEYQSAGLLGKAGQFVKALGKDSWASTKYSWGKIKNVFANFKKTSDVKKANKTVENYEKMEEADFDKLTTDQKTKLEEKYNKAQETINKNSDIVNKLKKRANDSQAAKKKLTEKQGKLKEAQENLENAKKQEGTTDECLESLEKAVKNAKKEVREARADVHFGKLTSKARAGLKESQTKEYLSDITSEGLGNIIKRIKASKDSSGLLSSLSKDARAVIEYLRGKECTYYDAVRQFGYENVLEALEAFAGARLTDETL